MKKTTKIFSVLLAVLMSLSVLPFAAFAEEAPVTEVSEDRLGAWKDNYQFLIDTVLDDTNYTSFNYVDINKKALKNEMNAYTAFALYDNAWKNYATHDVSIENARKILLALIEQADAGINADYIDKIVKILETADDVAGVVEKVDDILNSGLTDSTGWSDTLKALNAAVKVANIAKDAKDQVIKAYAEILSVRQANIAYIDFLTYIAENAKGRNDVLATAAQQLVDSLNEDLNDQIKKVTEALAIQGAFVTVEYLANIAMNSNVYTAAVLKVYGVSKKVVDVLWNTSDKAVFLDALMCAYDFQALTSDWTEAKLNGEDADAAVYAFSVALAARDISEEALFNLKKADSDGVVGKIKNKLYGTVYNDIEVSKASLALIKEVMFAEDISGAKKVVAGLNIFCPVDVDITTKENAKLFALADGAEKTVVNEYGAFASVYSEYSKEYLKVAFLFDNYRVKLTGAAEGYVTLVMNVLEADGTINDWSFTDVKVEKGDTMVFDTTAVEAPFYTFAKKDGGIEKISFNDEFVESEQKEVTAKEVIDATVDVGKDEAKSFIEKIKEFFQNLFKNLFKFFKK